MEDKTEFSFRPFIHILENQNGTYSVFSERLKNYGTFSSIRKAKNKARAIQIQNRQTILIHNKDGIVTKMYHPKLENISISQRMIDGEKVKYNANDKSESKRLNFALFK